MKKIILITELTLIAVMLYTTNRTGARWFYNRIRPVL